MAMHPLSSTSQVLGLQFVPPCPALIVCLLLTWVSIFFCKFCKPFPHFYWTYGLIWEMKNSLQVLDKCSSLSVCSKISCQVCGFRFCFKSLQEKKFELVYITTNFSFLFGGSAFYIRNLSPSKGRKCPPISPGSLFLMFMIICKPEVRLYSIWSLGWVSPCFIISGKVACSH